MPALKHDSILRLLEGTKALCLAPLATGGAKAIAELNDGHYGAAMLGTLTAVGMFLALVTSVALAQRIVRRLNPTQPPETASRHLQGRPALEKPTKAGRTGSEARSWRPRPHGR